MLLGKDDAVLRIRQFVEYNSSLDCVKWKNLCSAQELRPWLNSSLFSEKRGDQGSTTQERSLVPAAPNTGRLLFCYHG